MSQQPKDVDYWKKKAKELEQEKAGLELELESARRREALQRQKVLTLPPPIDNNPIPRAKRDLLNPSQPAKTKRTKPFQYKGLTDPTLIQKTRKSSPDVIELSSPTLRRSPPRRSASSPKRSASPPRRSASPPRRSASSPKRSASPPKPLKSALKQSKSSPKTFILRPLDINSGKAVNSPPIVVEKSMTIGRANFKSLKKEPYFLSIPRDAFKVTTQDDELMVTSLRDTPTIEYQTGDEPIQPISKDVSVFLNKGDKLFIHGVLSFKISR